MSLPVLPACICVLLFWFALKNVILKKTEDWFYIRCLDKYQTSLFLLIYFRFHRGQPVYVEGKDLPRFPAIISAIGTEAVSVME